MNETSRNLVITGMMGTGKTTVSEVVAKRLGRKLVETDLEIERRLGKTIPEIFAQVGEGAFRMAEWELCQELAKEHGLVISTGGGFLLRRVAQDLMQGHAIFCLEASAETIAERTSSKQDRPLIKGQESERLGKIQNILDERRASYQRIFHQVSTENRTVEDIADEIEVRFALEGERSSAKVRYIQMPLERPYPVIVRSGVAFDLPSRLKWAGNDAKRVIVLTNDKLSKFYKDEFQARCLACKLGCEWLEIPDGERYKNLETVQELYQKLLTINTKRDDVIVAFGGGVVGDVAGFVAATYMRGLPFIQIPTTLLAMVDSSIGGKTGVDLEAGKNLIGAFKQPLMVLADPALLSTLPAEEFQSGMAEVIKHALIGDRDLFETLSKGETLAHEELVFRALKVKANIVEADPFEKNIRAVLNLGHTFGHAFEKVSHFELRHGYAVAIGMLAACELSFRLGLCASELGGRVEKVVKRFGLPTHVSAMRATDIIDAMRHDKKATSDALRFILIHDVGDVRLKTVADLALVKSALDTVIRA